MYIPHTPLTMMFGDNGVGGRSFCYPACHDLSPAYIDKQRCMIESAYIAIFKPIKLNTVISRLKILSCMRY